MSFQVAWHHQSDKNIAARRTMLVRMSDSLTVGREDGADIVVKDPAISRLHAEIFVDSNGVQVADKGSVNGIYLDGKRTRSFTWLPGQIVIIGPFQFELQPGNHACPELELPSRILEPSRPLARPQQRLDSMALDDSRIEPGSAAAGLGRIELGELFERACRNDRTAVRQLFKGFLGRTEQIVDCGYLGSLGFIFPERSFWCMTNSRVCGLLINRGGWMNFNFGFTKSLNRGLFVQPSLVKLWVWVIVWMITGLLLGVSLGFYGQAIMTSWSGSLFVGRMLGIAIFLIMLASNMILVPWVIRAYYRWVKAGCIFWTQEQQPIVIPADRNSLRDAQRFIGVFMDQKRMLPD